MTDKTKTRSTQSKEQELEARIEKLEAQLRKHQHSANGSSGDEVLGFCALPEVPEREFAPDVSPDRVRLILLNDKKWVNGTKLRYYFFERGRFSAGNDQKDLVREGFEVWQNIGIGISFEEVSDISEAEIRIGFLQRDGAWSFVGRDVIDIPLIT